MIKSQKNSYIVILIIFLVIAGFFAVNAYFETNKFQDIDAKINAKNIELNAITARANYLKNISDHSDEIKKSMTLLENKIGKSVAFNTVVADFRDIVNSYGSTTNFEPGLIVDKGDYKELSMKLDIKTTFGSLLNLMYTINNPQNPDSRSFRVDTFSFKMDSGGVVTATISVVAFMYK